MSEKLYYTSALPTLSWIKVYSKERERKAERGRQGKGWKGGTPLPYTNF